MLRWTKDNLVTGLTKLPPENDLEEKAIQLFKSVQGFMRDRFYTFADGLVPQIIDAIVTCPPLRNEVYVQVLKQLNHNQKKESRFLGWVLLALLAGLQIEYPCLYLFVLSLLLGGDTCDQIMWPPTKIFSITCCMRHKTPM